MTDATPCRVSAELRAYHARQADMTEADLAEEAAIRRELAENELASVNSILDAAAEIEQAKLVALICESPEIVAAILRQTDGLAAIDDLPELIERAPGLRAAVVDEISRWERIVNAAEHEHADLLHERRIQRGDDT